MNNIYLKDLLKLCDATLVCGNEDEVLDNFSKDTRTLNEKDIYVGIKGESFDGNTLYIEALKKGAKGCILDNDTVIDSDIIKKYPNCFIVLVEDTITCLQKIASYKRSLYNIPIIGVTGSVGKTSTKDIIASVMSQKYKTLKTDGNYNNHIGVPLTILRLRDHEAAVIEMGMSHLEEISVISKIARPTVSIITNVGTAHIGNLGSRENILKAKLEILDGMDNDGILVINNDNDMLHNWNLDNNKIKVVTFGIDNTSDYMAINTKEEDKYSEYSVVVDGKEENFKINVPGHHFVINGLCALAIGSIFNIPTVDIKKGIENFALTKKRMEIETFKGVTIINDCYNANLDSVNSALNYLGSLNGRKIAVLGDMLELGDFSETLHRMVAKTITDNKIDCVIMVGNETNYTYDSLLKNNYHNIYHFDNNNDAYNKLKEIMKPDDYILIKASFGMKFYEIYDKIKNN